MGEDVRREKCLEMSLVRSLGPSVKWYLVLNGGRTSRKLIYTLQKVLVLTFDD